VNTSWPPPIYYCLHLFGVHKYPFNRDYVPKEGHVIQPKLTLIELGIELLLSKPIQRSSQVQHLILLILGVYQGIVNKDYY